MTGKWDLQTQPGAPDESRWVKMAGVAQIGEINKRALLLLFLFHAPLSCPLSPPPPPPPQDGFILRAPQGQPHGPQYRSLSALCTAVFVTF